MDMPIYSKKIMKRAFSLLVASCVCAAAAILAALVMVLMAPLTVLFIANMILAGWRARHGWYPTDSGSAGGVVFAVSTALVGVYMLIYSIVGLQPSFITYPISTLFMALLPMFYFYLRGEWQKVTELFKWAFLSVDRRIVAIWSAFIFGTQEAAVSFSQMVLTWLVWLPSALADSVERIEK